MTEAEWLAYLDKFMALERLQNADVIVLFGALAERINTVIVGHINRLHDENQSIRRELVRLRARLDKLEGGRG